MLPRCEVKWSESRSVVSDSLWVAILFFKGSSQPRDRTRISHIAGRFFTSWATRDTPKVWRVAFFLWWSYRRLHFPPFSCNIGKIIKIIPPHPPPHTHLLLWPSCKACGILVLSPGVEPVPLATEVRNLNNWNGREVLPLFFFFFFFKEEKPGTQKVWVAGNF